MEALVQLRPVELLDARLRPRALVSCKGGELSEGVEAEDLDLDRGLRKSLTHPGKLNASRAGVSWNCTVMSVYMSTLSMYDLDVLVAWARARCCMT